VANVHACLAVYGCPCLLPFIIFPKAYAMKENYDQSGLLEVHCWFKSWTRAIHCKSKGNAWSNLSITGIDTHLLHMNNRSNIQTLRVSEATKYIHYDINLQLLCEKMSCKLESDVWVEGNRLGLHTKNSQSLKLLFLQL
jgi:hypothetical protein